MTNLVKQINDDRCIFRFYILLILFEIYVFFQVIFHFQYLLSTFLREFS